MASRTARIVQPWRGRSSACSTRRAAVAAPKPLSMLTTTTPGAQLASAAGQRRPAACGDAVADRGRHRDQHAPDQAGQHAEQGTLHAGDGDHDRHRGQMLAALQQPPEAGDAEVGMALGRVAGKGERSLGLGRHRQVGGAGGDDRPSGPDPAPAGRR